MKTLLHISFLLIILFATACNNNEAERNIKTKAEKDSLRRLDSIALKIGVLPSEDCLPIIVAERLRIFDTLGVVVHLRHYKAMSECRHALTDSLVEGAVIDTLLMQALNGNESWLYGAMNTQLSWQLLVSKKSRISRLNQFGDKTIAADSHGMSHKLAEEVQDTLKKKKAQAFIIQVEDLKVRTEMLTTGNVDAALLPEPFASKAKAMGAVALPLKSQTGNAGILAMRTSAMQSAHRKEQMRLFLKAITIANDSIRRYGKTHYTDKIY